MSTGQSGEHWPVCTSKPAAHTDNSGHLVAPSTRRSLGSTSSRAPLATYLSFPLPALAHVMSIANHSPTPSPKLVYGPAFGPLFACGGNTRWSWVVGCHDGGGEQAPDQPHLPRGCVFGPFFLPMPTTTFTNRLLYCNLFLARPTIVFEVFSAFCTF